MDPAVEEYMVFNTFNHMLNPETANFYIRFGAQEFIKTTNEVPQLAEVLAEDEGFDGMIKPKVEALSYTDDELAEKLDQFSEIIDIARIIYPAYFKDMDIIGMMNG